MLDGYYILQIVECEQCSDAEQLNEWQAKHIMNDALKLYLKNVEFLNSFSMDSEGEVMFGYD